ncbi:hypothetical protein EAI_14046 [Harpegnathos saltator]|uniref:Uncharacterized protein n=1 Tax=Harpegnathos saltator TaxID=610380 RepID=E2BYR7_HARSA|nr:hypothetical protein EAI_14046 [Harpegnathos saltator]
MTEGDILIGNLLLLRRNIADGVTAQLTRWKSTQSSCEKDNRSRKSPRCIEDHQQAAEPCGKTLERCSDGLETAEGSQPSSCGDLLNQREYHRSIGSACPIYLCKPEQYNDRRACDSPTCDSTARDSHECSQSEVADADAGRVISCKRWASGKAATDGEIRRRCRPKPCASPHPSDREEEKCPPSHTPADRDGEEAEDAKRDEPERSETVSQQCPDSEVPRLEGIGTSLEQEAPCAKDRTSSKCPISDPYEDQTKLDPPPPRQQHWSENPPAYCEHCPKKTCKATVEPSPMMFVPHEMIRRKSRAKDAESPCCASNANKAEDEAEAKPEETCATPREASSRRRAFAEDKCADSPELLAAVGEAKPKPSRWFPALTRLGRCRAKKLRKKFAVSDDNDCKPNVASLKYRLSKCLRMGGMRKIRDCESSKARRKRWALLSLRRCSASRETATRRTGKRIESSCNGRAQRRHEVCLRIFRKRNRQLDPCLPPIAELRQPRAGQTESCPSKLFKSTVNGGVELSPRLGRPCPFDYGPAERPVTETKSYPTKMDECRTARVEGPRKRRKSTRRRRC